MLPTKISQKDAGKDGFVVESTCYSCEVSKLHLQYPHQVSHEFTNVTPAPGGSNTLPWPLQAPV